jgi:Barstar (barnase inhibitor)
VKNPIIKIDTRQIIDWPTFHSVFAEKFGFPDFYGRNMGAWVDCMTSLDEPSDGMTSIHALSGGVVVLQLEHVDDFAARCPDIYAVIIESAAFVNWRRIEMGREPVLSLSFEKTPSRLR